jgi:hypothetical protein
MDRDVPQWLTELTTGQLHGIVNTGKFDNQELTDETLAMVAEILKGRGEQPTVPVPDPISPDAHFLAQSAREAAREASGRIVKHLWIIFVCLPVVLGILFAILTAK